MIEPMDPIGQEAMDKHAAEVIREIMQPVEHLSYKELEIIANGDQLNLKFYYNEIGQVFTNLLEFQRANR